MSKVVITDLGNLENQSAAVSNINTNLHRLADAVENTLSRNGTAPNTMGANLDMNSRRMVNLPAPVNQTEPLRLKELQDILAHIYEIPVAATVDFNTATVTATGSTTPRSLASRFAEVFNVLDYGADKTGAANSRTAINAAITACNAAGGGTVYFPPGRYLVEGGSVQNLTGQYVAIKGESANSSIIVNGNAAAPAMVVGTSSGVYGNGPFYYGNEVSNLSFIGKAGVTGLTGQTGLTLYNQQNIRLTNVCLGQNRTSSSPLYICLRMYNILEMFILNVEIDYALTYGFYLEASADIYACNMRAMRCKDIGFVYIGMQGSYFVNVHAYGSGNYGSYFAYSARENKDNTFIRCISDTSGNHNTVILDLKESEFTSCWSSSQTRYTITSISNPSPGVATAVFTVGNGESSRPQAGQSLRLFGMSNAAYDGNAYTVTSATDTTVTFACAATGTATGYALTNLQAVGVYIEPGASGSVANLTYHGGTFINNNGSGVKSVHGSSGSATGVRFIGASFGSTSEGTYGNGQSLAGYGLQQDAGDGDIQVLGGKMQGNASGAYLLGTTGTVVIKDCYEAVDRTTRLQMESLYTGVVDATYTVLEKDSSIICNRLGTVTLTLPTASTCPGRVIKVRTTTANTVVSASSNVTPLANPPGTGNSTAILSATAGKWAILKSDGAQWNIEASN
jgi:hypothetical protein